MPQNDKALGKWVSINRRRHKNNKMPHHRIRLLEEIGFDFSRIVPSWDDRLESLKEFYEQKGHFQVPRVS